MLKLLAVMAVLGQMSAAQKSFYSSQQSWYPKVLARYKTTSTTTEGLVNRIGENTISPRPESTPPFAQDGNLDYDQFIRRVSSWPEDKQPFWYKNRLAISSMINQSVDGNNRSSGNPVRTNFRSPFAGQRG